MLVELPTALSRAITPEQLVRTVKHLPAAPKILPRLKLLLRDGNSALGEIVRLVRLDPGLALRVLQIANSPFFHTGGRCVTVEDAVSRVGYDEIYALISYAVAAQALNRPLAVYGIEADELWARSVACALGAEAVATWTGDDPAVAYTLGLLHGVGMIAIDEWALHSGEHLVLTMTDFPREATTSERAQLGFTQADAGAALLHAWEFPAETIEPVRYQYSPRSSPAHGHSACLLAVAKWIRAAVLAPGQSPPPPIPVVSELDPLGIGPAVLTRLARDVAREFRFVTSVLDAAREPGIDRRVFPAQTWRC